MTVINEATLSRATANVGPAAPIRIVHLGLGAFHRSHQAWYTDQVDAGREWGIAAFTGRSPDAATALAAQQGVYTLVTRSDEADSMAVVGAISAAYDGADLDRLTELVAAPPTAIVTITVTESAYHLGADRSLNLSAEAVVKDVAALTSWLGDQPATGEDRPRPTTMGGRLLLGLDARRRAGSGPIAVVSCDNLSANGPAAREAILGMASAVSADLASWIQQNVSFVSTSVDRITPRTTSADVLAVQSATGLHDVSPVVTEPFTSWVLSGAFPAGRPDWESAGAVFVDDITPFEQRKLWLLNGAHSLLAYAGQLRGCHTVAEAVAEKQCAAWLTDFWDEAAQHLTGVGLDVPAYRAALLGRFGNTRIEHRLSQIATDGTTKLRMRAVPVLLAERAAGRTGTGAARVIAAWVDYLSEAHRGAAVIDDSEAPALTDLLEREGIDRTAALARHLSAELAADHAAVDMIHELRSNG